MGNKEMEKDPNLSEETLENIAGGLSDESLNNAARSLSVEMLEKVSGGVTGSNIMYACPCGAAFNTEKELKDHRKHCGVGKLR